MAFLRCKNTRLDYRLQIFVQINIITLISCDARGNAQIKKNHDYYLNNHPQRHNNSELGVLCLMSEKFYPQP